MADGTVYTQSQAVLRVVGRMGRLIPSDDHAYRTDKLLEDAEDLRRASYKCFVTWGASREDAEDFAERVLPLHLGNLERQLGAAPFFLGEALTLADVACYDAVVLRREPRARGAGGVPGPNGLAVARGSDAGDSEVFGVGRLRRPREVRSRHAGEVRGWDRNGLRSGLGVGGKCQCAKRISHP